MVRRIRYMPPAGSVHSDPFIRFNIAMTGMTAKEVGHVMGYSEAQVKKAATEYVPKCDFIAAALTAFPALKFYDLFLVMTEGDGTYHVNKMLPLPLSYEEAVANGLRLEPDPAEAKMERPSQPLRINIYEDDKPVCGYGPNGEFYRYGKAFRESAIAQYLDRNRHGAEPMTNEDEDDDDDL